MVPTKMGFFTLEASWGKVLTLDYVKCRGSLLANRCFLCEEEEETIDHWSMAKALGHFRTFFWLLLDPAGFSP